MRDVATRLAEIVGKPDLLQFGKAPLDQKPMNVVADIERLSATAGYKPLVDVDLGLRRCYEFWANGEQCTKG